MTCPLQAEAAWRARHKWAAQRLANLLGDAHAKPPLAPVLDFVERVSVNIGLAVGGAGVGSTPGSWAWAAPTEGCSAQLGGSHHHAQAGPRCPGGGKGRQSGA